MKRRGFVKALVTAPAVPALIAQQPAPPTGVPSPVRPGIGSIEHPKIDVSSPDIAAEPVLHFFTKPQFAALQKLSDLLMPAMNGTPGALDAKAPEFIDFLIGESPAERQKVYRAGLDALNAQAGRKFRKPFADLDESDAASLLSSLKDPWTYEPPADPLARFLRVAKVDVRTATMNSREYSAVAAASGQRRFGGGGLYWYPLD